MKTITDHELSKIADDWAKTAPVNTGIRTAFAQGFRHSESINKPKRLLMPTMNIQAELQKIHNLYGTSEMADYQVQLLFEKYVNEALNQQVNCDKTTKKDIKE